MSAILIDVAALELYFLWRAGSPYGQCKWLQSVQPSHAAMYLMFPMQWPLVAKGLLHGWKLRYDAGM